MSYRARKTGIPELDRELLTLEVEISKLSANSVRRTIVKSVALTTADRKVTHGLGHPITGYNVIRQSANATVFEVTPSTAPATWVMLRSSAAVVVTLEFF